MATWKVNGSRVDGFLAHEAQAVVQEAITKIETLEARVTALES